MSSGASARKMVRGFRQRGDASVLRIESFSDAVFGFSVTLLVVSLQVPRTFDDLLRTLAGFPAFALAFVLLAQIWVVQNRFFRRYALSDSTTTWLTIALLFVIVYFTFPLKFLFSFAVPGDVSSVIRPNQLTQMYAIYALGYGAVFAIFALLHAHALRKREELELTPVEIFYTRRSIVLAIFQIGVAAVSVSLAALFSARGAYGSAGMFGGLAYGLIPIGVWIISQLGKRERVRLERELVAVG